MKDDRVLQTVAQRLATMPAPDTSRAVIDVERNHPVLGTPAIAFWGGATLVTAFYDAGRQAG